MANDSEVKLSKDSRFSQARPWRWPAPTAPGSEGPSTDADAVPAGCLVARLAHGVSVQAPHQRAAQDMGVGKHAIAVNSEVQLQALKQAWEAATEQHLLPVTTRQSRPSAQRLHRTSSARSGKTRGFDFDPLAVSLSSVSTTKALCRRGSVDGWLRDVLCSSQPRLNPSVVAPFIVGRDPRTHIDRRTQSAGPLRAAKRFEPRTSFMG